MADNEIHQANGEPNEPQKFKFSIAKGKATQKRKDSAGGLDEVDKAGGEKELIRALQGSDVVAADGSLSTKGGAKIIPSLGNTWKPGGKQGPDRPQSALHDMMHEVENKDRFEEAAADEEKDGGVQYGLSVRNKSPVDGRDKGSKVPLRDLEAQKLKEDLGSLPDEAGMDAYESMPIENFGEALLRGMGWKEGQGIGRNGKGVAEAVEYVPRPSRLGLGATPKQKPEQEKKYIKPGETRDKPKDLVAPIGPDGKVRHVRKVSEKLVERDSGEVKEGKIVRIVEGRHKGLEGKVRSLAASKSSDGVRKWKVRLLVNEEDVEVWEDELVDRKVWEQQNAEAEARRRALKLVERRGGRSEGRGDGDERKELEQRPSKRIKEVQERSEKQRSAAHSEHRRDKDRKHHGSDGRGGDLFPGENDRIPKRDAGTAGRGGVEVPQRNPVIAKSSREEKASHLKSSLEPWLMPHIRVRIISKKRAGGRLYLSKGVVADVMTPVQCDVLLDGKLVEGVNANELETALPKRGGRVAVLRGAYRGERGKLLEKSSESEEAVVQLSQTFDVIRVALDDVAEFVGEEVAYE